MNRDKHISSAFDRDLETIQAMVVKMGGMVEAAITDAATALAAQSMHRRTAYRKALYFRRCRALISQQRIHGAAADLFAGK